MYENSWDFANCVAHLFFIYLFIFYLFIYYKYLFIYLFIYLYVCTCLHVAAFSNSVFDLPLIYQTSSMS